MKQKAPLFPRYAVCPLSVTVILNMITYYVSRLITGSMIHYNFTFPIDTRIPFVPAAIVIYVLAFPSWAVGYLVVCRENQEVCGRLLAGEQIAKLLCLLIFLLVPTTMIRPAVPGHDVFSWGTRLIYALDTPDNLLPSIHCLENWILFRGALRCKKVGRGYKISFLLFTLMVFASTLLVKQHLVVDVAAGVLVGEIGLWLCDRLGAQRIYLCAAKKA